ncbi:MAG: alanine racemase [Candidatus Omnitrophica bacterium]|nr:alanine racemase [Candidatus Omnitrophota bacterium]
MDQTSKYSQPLTRVEIDLAAVRHNFQQVSKLAARQLEPRINHNVDILSVVKADSYGHGMVACAKVIDQAGGRFFAVSNAQEGAQLRASGNKRRILLFESTLPEIAKDLVKYDLTPSVCTLAFARELDRCAKKARKKVAIHVKVDTGMSRLGVPYSEAVDFVKGLARLGHIQVEGILTHFPVADTDRHFTEKQIEAFSDVIAELIKAGVPFKYLHAANSMGIGGYRNRYFNLVRPGVMLYGLYPDAALRSAIALKPVMSVKTRVLFVKTIRRGSGISYGHTFKALSDIPTAVLAIGYSDGYLRAMSNKAHVLINGLPCPVLGRVTMDQTIVDISLAQRGGTVEIGDEAVVLGQQRDSEISADDLAEWADTINYEIACNLGNRLPRIYLK